MAVARGRVFTLGNTNGADTVFSFDAASGSELWKYSYACPLDPQHYEGGPGATPTVDSNRVYTLSKFGHLFCFQAATGKVLWQKNLLDEPGVKKPRWGFAGSPLVEGNLLILNAGGGGMALDKHSGKVVWTSSPEAAGYATPVPFDWKGERYVAVFSSKSLVGVKVKTGAEAWRLAWVTRWDLNIADPIVAGNHLFISSFDQGGALVQLAEPQPKVVWKNKSMANHFNSCVCLEGHLYGVDGNTDAPPKDLRCVELATGQVKWRYEGLGLGALVAADGMLVVLSDKGELVIARASPRLFRPLSRAQVLGGKCWTTPVLAIGRVYCRNAQGILVCLDVAGRGPR